MVAVSLIPSFLHLEDSDWDLIICGDGSGTLSSTPGGWACYALEKQEVMGEGRSKVIEHPAFYAGYSAGAAPLMEALPYWMWLRYWYYELEGQEVCKKKKVQVHIVTDSEWVYDAMGGKANIKKHKDIRNMYHYLETWNLRLSWHRVPRNTLDLQVKADQVAGICREYFNLMEIPE